MSNKTTSYSLRLKDVQVVRNDSVILEKINLHLLPGENLLVIGDNGSGKTTFLQLLCGLIKPTKGKMELANNIMTKKTHRNFQKRIAYIPQNLGLIDESSVERNILLGAISNLHIVQTLLGIFPSTAKQKAAELMKTFGIDHLKFKKTKHLSGGERKKVAIARAFMQTPELLLIDEMLSDLAPKAAQKILNDLTIMQKKLRFNTIFVEHHVNNILDINDWLVTLENGHFTHKIPKKQMKTFVNQYFFEKNII